ncbi:MAG: hypothetical protein QXR45_15550 [Candidatus Bathyarchaeia archaeon]
MTTTVISVKGKCQIIMLWICLVWRMTIISSLCKERRFIIIKRQREKVSDWSVHGRI